MFQYRLSNGLSSGRKQQTAVKQTVDRPKSKTWYKDTINYRTHPYSPPSIVHNHQLINEDQNWLKSSTKIFDNTPELDLTCQEETLTDIQLQNYPTQAYDPTAPLPLPAVRKRTSVLKKLTTQEIEILQDPDEDFIPSESDDDDDDDENYLPEHDRRPYNRSHHLNGTIGGRGRGRGGRSHLISTNTRLPPSTHFVRPQPETTTTTSHSHSQQLYSSSSINNNSFEIELERTYPTTLSRYYGTRNGQSINSTDYGDFRIKCSICNEQSSNNMSFIAHLCSHFEDDLNYISPFDKFYRQCSICHSEFSTPYQTLLHKDQEHMIEFNEYRCRICQLNHNNLTDLFSHLNYIHIDLDMPYCCDRCNYRTSMYEDLAYHIRQIHKDTQYFFCPYCFQSVLLPSISDTNILDSTPAVRHIILHFDRIENSNNKQQQRRIESLFKYCNRCVLHVKSLKEHYTYHHHHHHSNINEQKLFINNEENYLKRNNNNYYHHQMNDTFNHRSKFDRIKQLPMATIRRRQTTSNNYESVHINNRWYSRR